MAVERTREVMRKKKSESPNQISMREDGKSALKNTNAAKASVAIFY